MNKIKRFLMAFWRELKGVPAMELWNIKCENCNGTGIDPIEPEHGCNGCDGSGRADKGGAR